LALYKDRQTQVILALGALPATDGGLEPWRRFVRAVAERGRGKVAGYQVGQIQSGAVPDVGRYVYLLKLAAVQIRSVDSAALFLQGAVPAADLEWQGRVLAAGAG